MTEAADRKEGSRARDPPHQAARDQIARGPAPEQRPAGTTWEQALSTAAVSLGLLAIIFAVLAVIFREEKLLAGIAVTLGAAAIAVQIWWVLVIVAFAMIIANAFLSFLS